MTFVGESIMSAADDGTIRLWSRRDTEDRIRWYSSGKDSIGE